MVFSRGMPARSRSMSIIDLDLVNKFLGLFHSCNGVISMKDIVTEVSPGKREFTESQQSEIETFETALMQMHWVVAALDQCENEIKEYSNSSKKRKTSEGGINLNVSKGEDFLSRFFDHPDSLHLNELRFLFYIISTCFQMP